MLSTGNHTNIWMKDSCVLDNVSPGQSSIAICPYCNLRQNVNNYGSNNEVGYGTSPHDATCDNAINFNPFWTPFCVSFEGTGSGCGIDPEPFCVPSSSNDGVETCFQFDWDWEDCDPTIEDCDCDAFMRSLDDDSPNCVSCRHCPDGTLSWDCTNINFPFYRKPYRDCNQNEAVCELGPDGYLKCLEYNGKCTEKGCHCEYSVLDRDLNKFQCASCGFCADGSISYDCTEFGQGFHICDNKDDTSDLYETICLPDSDGDGVVNCFRFEPDWQECDPSKEDCPCEAFVRSKQDGDSVACHSCERCVDETMAWNCYNVDHDHFRVPFRSCEKEKEHCELEDDGHLHCAVYNAGCIGEENCPCMYSIRDNTLGRFSCGECSFCADGTLAYDCSMNGYGTRSCDDDVVCCEDCREGTSLFNKSCDECIICNDPEIVGDWDDQDDAILYLADTGEPDFVRNEEIYSPPSSAPSNYRLPSMRFVDLFHSNF